MPEPTAITAGVPCASCGYDLTGLDRDALCPECAHPVAMSLQGDLLRFHEPRWLAKVTFGLRMMRWGANTIACTLLAAVLALLATIVLNMIRRTGAEPPEWVLIVFTMLLGLGLVTGLLLVAIGSVPAGATLTGSGASVRMRSWPGDVVRWGGPGFVVAVLASPGLQALAPTWDPNAQAVVKGLCQAGALGYLWGLVARLRDLETRTLGWNVERFKAYGYHRRDLVIAGVLYVLFGWVLWFPGSRGGGAWGASFAVLLMLLLANTIGAAAIAVRNELRQSRVRHAKVTQTGAHGTQAPT